jgi:hypothetical protein
MKTLYPSKEFELFMTKERDERLKPKGAFLKWFDFELSLLTPDMSVKFMISILLHFNLDPINHTIELDDYSNQQILTVFQKCARSQEEANLMHTHFSL